MARDLNKDIEVINTAAMIVGAESMVIVPTDGCVEFKDSVLTEAFGSIDVFNKPGYVVSGGIVDAGNETFKELIMKLSDDIRAAESVQDLIDVFFDAVEEEVK